MGDDAALESDGDKIDEELRMVYNYGKIEGDNFWSVFRDVEVMKMVLETMSEGSKGHEVVGY